MGIMVLNLQDCQGDEGELSKSDLNSKCIATGALSANLILNHRTPPLLKFYYLHFIHNETSCWEDK